MTQEKGLVTQAKDSAAGALAPLPIPAREVLRRATEQADVLMDVVHQKKLFALIENKKFLEAEAWQVVSAFNQAHWDTEWTRPIEQQGEIVGYEAKVNLVKQGEVVGSAIMSCGLDEFPCRGKEGEAQHKAAKSAAQTWAGAKAARMNYAWVAVLAGFQPTPADEMRETDRPSEKPKVEEAPMGKCSHGVVFKQRTGAMGSWWSAAHKLPDGKWCPERPQARKVVEETGEIIEDTAQEVPEPSQPPAPGRSAAPTTGVGIPPGWPQAGAPDRDATDEGLAATHVVTVAPLQRRPGPAPAMPQAQAVAATLATEAQLESLKRIGEAKGTDVLAFAAKQGIAHVAELTRLTYNQASQLISALQRREPHP